MFELLQTRAPRPDLLVVLRADVDTLMARVAGRARAFEEALSREYMERVVAAYEGFGRDLVAARLEAAADDDFDAVAERVRAVLVDSAA